MNLKAGNLHFFSLRQTVSDTCLDIWKAEKKRSSVHLEIDPSSWCPEPAVEGPGIPASIEICNTETNIMHNKNNSLPVSANIRFSWKPIREDFKQSESERFYNAEVNSKFTQRPNTKPNLQSRQLSGPLTSRIRNSLHLLVDSNNNDDLTFTEKTKATTGECAENVQERIAATYVTWSTKSSQGGTHDVNHLSLK